MERQVNPQGYRRIPVRTISLTDNSIKQVFDDAHNLAEWVVNYDDLLDPEQLRHYGVRVIRYQKDRSNGRNLVVSSTARSRVLEVLIRRRLEELGLGLGSPDMEKLVKRLIADAIAISGEIVLRASKRGIAAGELIGIVLSAALARSELGNNPTACFFLDDYATWLGQKEEGIADLLFISFDPAQSNQLRIIITEAKYIGSPGASDARKTSRRQVEATVSRINDALFENPGRFDRDLWLSRLADLLLDAVKSPREERLFEGLRRRIRNASIAIDLRGYSHVFVSDSTGPLVASDQEEMPATCGEYSLQEIYSHRDSTCEGRRQAGKRWKARRTVRAHCGPRSPWKQASWRAPAARPAWMVPYDEPTESTSPREVSPHIGKSEVPPPPARPSPVAPEPIPADVVGGDTEHAARVPAFEDLLRTRRSAEVEATDAVWLEQASRNLQRALVGWGFQAKVLGTRLTPNAGLVRLFGS